MLFGVDDDQCVEIVVHFFTLWKVRLEIRLFSPLAGNYYVRAPGFADKIQRNHREAIMAGF